MQDPNKYAITVSEFAKRMSLCNATAYAMTEQPGFPLLRAGKRKLVLVGAPLEEWLRQRTAAK